MSFFGRTAAALSLTLVPAADKMEIRLVRTGLRVENQVGMLRRARR